MEVERRNEETQDTIKVKDNCSESTSKNDSSGIGKPTTKVYKKEQTTIKCKY